MFLFQHLYNNGNVIIYIRKYNNIKNKLIQNLQKTIYNEDLLLIVINYGEVKFNIGQVSEMRFLTHLGKLLG